MIASTSFTTTTSQSNSSLLDLPLPHDHQTWATVRLFDPLVAMKLGDRHAYILNQIHYWIEKECGKVYLGFRWIYNGYEQWREQFPWLSVKTIGKIIRELEQTGILVSNNFNNNRHQRTKWYTIDYYQLALQTGFNPLNLDLTKPHRRPPTEAETIRFEKTFLQLDPDSDSNEELPDWLDESKPLPQANLQKSDIGFKQISPLHNRKLASFPIYKSHPKLTKSNPDTDEKENEENNQEVEVVENLSDSNQQFVVIEKLPVEVLKENKLSVSSLLDPDEETSSAGFISDEFSTDEEMEVEGVELVTGLFTALDEVDERERHRLDPPQRWLRIAGLEEDELEILWKYQKQLLELNVDLDAERIHLAVADHPQNLEDAILALIEDSAKGQKISQEATGYFYNALRNGWKPKQAHVKTVTPDYFTAPPEFFEERRPASLAEVLERKQKIWKIPTLRPGVEEWANHTPGVILTENGPMLAETRVEVENVTPNAQFEMAIEAGNGVESEMPVVESLTPKLPAEGKIEADLQLEEVDLEAEVVVEVDEVETINSESEESLPVQVQPQVGQWVFWNQYPLGRDDLYCSRVSRVEGDWVWLEDYSVPVPVVQLRWST